MSGWMQSLRALARLKPTQKLTRDYLVSLLTAVLLALAVGAAIMPVSYTHLDEVARTLDYAVMIDGGHLLAQGSPEEMTRLYLCVSGSAEEVGAATAGLAVLREEEVAGTLVRYMRLNAPEDAERIRACGRVQTCLLYTSFGVLIPWHTYKGSLLRRVSIKTCCQRPSTNFRFWI